MISVVSQIKACYLIFRQHLAICQRSAVIDYVYFIVQAHFEWWIEGCISFGCCLVIMENGFIYFFSLWKEKGKNLYFSKWRQIEAKHLKSMCGFETNNFYIADFLFQCKCTLNSLHFEDLKRCVMQKSLFSDKWSKLFANEMTFNRQGNIVVYV